MKLMKGLEGLNQKYLIILTIITFITIGVNILLIMIN